MRYGIIGGTGVEMPGEGFTPQLVTTPFGEARVFIGEGAYADIVFLSRHGEHHDIPPHKVNFRANIWALRKLAVSHVLASFAVGSISEEIAPGSAVAIDQIIDFTHGREQTFHDGGERGLYHVPFTEPICSSLRAAMIARAPTFGLDLRPQGTYVCFNGPRFETAAEIRMFGLMGAEVVGMTAMPEAALARELGIHYAGVAVSVNWAAGVRGPLVLDLAALDGIRGRLLPLFLDTLRAADQGPASCTCAEAEGHQDVIGSRPAFAG